MSHIDSDSYNIAEHWPQIARLVSRGQASTIYCSMASVNPDGTPNVTPVGTVFLRDNPSGYYFDHYTSALARNLDANPNICVMAVNAGRLFWLRSLALGRFTSPPGVRLYGTVGALRPATANEIQQVQRRVRSTKWLKGNRLLWAQLTQVRDIAFTTFRPVTYPVMMNGLWQRRWV